MAAFENTIDISGFKGGEQFYIDKYDSKSYDNIEKAMDEILDKEDNNVIKEYITKYIPEEERNVTYNFKCSTNTIIKLNDRFIASQNLVAPPPDGDADQFNAVVIENMLYNSIKNYSSIVENRNKELKQRYIILQEKILKNNVRRNLEKQQQSMFAFLNRITYLGVISGVSVFCVKLVLISNLTNPAVWIGFLSKIYANPLYFQYFVDILSTLNIFTVPEILTLKDMFSKLQILMKQTPLFQNKEYVDTLVKCIFNPTPENRKILQNLGSNENFKDHDKNPQLMQFFSYIKSVTDVKNVFRETGEPSEKQPIWKKNLLNEAFTFYTSPLGNTALTSLKIATDAYGYFSQSADFFTKYKDANPALLFKGITLNSVNSYSFNIYSRIFTQNLLNKIAGSKDSTLILDIPVIGSLDVNTFFVTTVDSFLNIQVKSMLTGYFTKLEQEVGYDPEKEKKEKEKEKDNSVEAVKANIIEKGLKVQKYERQGYSNEQIAKILDRPKRPNDYKFFLSRYMKNFYNTFLDVLDDPLVTIEIFTNVSFVFNIIQNNFYSILMGGGLLYLPQMVLTGFAHRSYLNLGSLTGNLVSYDIVPIKIITAYFRFKYGSDIVINRQFELLKYNLINDVFSDIQTLLNEMQSVFFDTSLGMSVNRYLEQLNDTIMGRLFKMSCKISYLFVNFAVLPSVKNKIVNLLPNIKFPIIETLENKEKSERLFTFMDNKISNLVKATRSNIVSNLDIEKLIKVMSKDFGEFMNISKIIEGTIIPYLNADGFFEWSGKMKSPLEGSIIKFVEQPLGAESVDEKIAAYAGDILSESKQSESRVSSIKIVLGTDDSGYGNFKVVDTKEIKSLLEKVYDQDTKFDPRNKKQGWFIDAFETAYTMLSPEGYKKVWSEKGWGFTDDDIDKLFKDGIKIGQIEQIMKEVDPKTGNTPSAEQVMASILASDSLKYKTSTAGSFIDLVLGDTGNLIKDFSMSNIYYYYYYKLFINEELNSKKAEFDRKIRERQEKEEAEMQLLVVGSRIMFGNNPAIIKEINSDGTFDVEDNNGRLTKNVPKDSITPQVGSLRNLSKKEQNEKDKEEFLAVIEKDEKKLSKQDDFDTFAVFLQDRFNKIDLKKRNGEPYSIYEHAIITDMLTSLKTRESSITYNYLWDNKGDVIKSILVDDNGVQYLDGFFEGLYGGKYDNPENPDIKLKTEILDKSDLIHTEDKNAYFGVNLQHSYGFSPQVIHANKFLNSIEMLISLKSDSIQVATLSSMIDDLEKRAVTDVNIQNSLDTLNDLYVKPIADISSYYEKFVEYFKYIFCNIKTGGCNKENMVFFKHMNFNYDRFYEKMKETLEPNNLLNNIKKMIKNNIIIEFLKNNAEIKYVCNLNGTQMFLNKTFINMNTGDLMSDCINNSRDIDYSNEEEVLQILLRPETIFGLSKISKLPKDEYDKLKSDAVPKDLNSLYGLMSDKDKVKEYDSFFKLFNSFGEYGIKSTTEATNIPIFSIISDVIDSQEKDFDSKKLEIDPIEKYKLQLLFNFNKILKSQTQGFIDPSIKKSYIDYFTQKEDILDNTEFLNNNQSALEKLFNDVLNACKSGDVKASKELLQQIKKNYFDKDVIGSINLNGHILRRNDINFQDPNSKALNDKLNEYVKYESEPETGFANKKNSLDILLNRNINEQDLGELCKDSGLEFMGTYISERKEWYNKQSELFKLYILHNTNDVFGDLSKKYNKFTDDIAKVIEDYTKNLSIIWSNVAAQDINVAVPPPQLTGMADELQRKEQLDKIDTQVRQQTAQATSAAREKTETAEALAKPAVKEKPELGTKTEETVTQSTETKTEESLDIQLQYGTSANPQHFGNMLDSLIKTSPSTIYTDTFKQMPPIDTELKDKIEEKNKLTNPSAECARQSGNWHVEYDGSQSGPEKYVVKTQGDLTVSEINSNGCQTTSLMYDLAININYLIMQSSKIIIPIIQKIENMICNYFPIYCPYIRVLLTLSKVYSTCFIYMFHDVMHKKFSDPDMVDKLTNGYANLSDKLVFGLWTQMINTLKTAEGKIGINNRSDDMLCNNIMPLIGGIIGGSDISNLENNSYTLIDEIGSKIKQTGNPNINVNDDPSLTNLPGYIDTGLREGGINYSNYAEVALQAGSTFLNIEEQAAYDELMKKSSISCNDLYPKFDKITALKLSINSLIRNPTKNFFFTNLNCRLFGSNNIDPNNKDSITLSKMLYMFLFTDWRELIKDFMVIMFTNEGLKPFFLTKLFGNKSLGRKKNFIRDLIDDSFDTAKKKYANNQKGYEDYIQTEVSNGIYKFLINIVTSFFGQLFNLDNKLNGNWVGIDQPIYNKFKDCKGGLCSFESIEKVTKEAILNLQNELAVINPGYLFNTTVNIDLESEESKKLINDIVNSESYENFIGNLRTSDEAIINDPELNQQWKRTIYKQYKEVLSFYKEYSEYNTAIIKHISENLKKNENVGFQYRVKNYNYRNIGSEKLETFLKSYLIKPCPEGQILYFFTKDDVVSFNCLDFSDINMENFEDEKLDSEEIFEKGYKKFADSALKENIKILDLFVKSKDVICDNPEYCSGISTTYAEFITQKNAEFAQLLNETTSDIDKIKDFQKTFLEDLTNKLTDLTSIYQKKQKELLNAIREIDSKITNINEQLKNESLEEDDKFLKLQEKGILQAERSKLEMENKYFDKYIYSITDSSEGLFENIKEAKKIGSLSTPEMVTQDFIISELQKTDITPEYFAFLYCKLFSISEDNVDILNLYEFFNSDNKKITDLESKITNNKYYFKPELYDSINNKLLENKDIRESILKFLKVFLYKNQKEQYLYTGKFENGYYIKDKEGGRKDISNGLEAGSGFEIVKDQFSEIKPHDVGIEETEEQLKKIQAMKDKLQKRIEREKIKSAELDAKSSEAAKKLMKKYEELEVKKKEIRVQLDEIRKKDEEYYKTYKKYFKEQEKKEEQAKKDFDDAQNDYDTANSKFEKLVKEYDTDYYTKSIKPYLDQKKAEKDEYKKLDKFLKDYMGQLKKVAETDYNKKRYDTQNVLIELLKANKVIEEEMLKEDITDNEYDKLFKQWTENLQKINEYDSFLMKSIDDQEFDIQLLTSKYYNEYKVIENSEYSNSKIIKKKYDRLMDLYYKIDSIPEYIQTSWQIIKATIKTGWNKFTRFLGFGESEIDKQKKYEEYKNKVQEEFDKLDGKIKNLHKIEAYNKKISNALTGYIEPTLYEEKRSYLNIFGYDDFLDYDKMKNSYFTHIDPRDVKFTDEMNNLRRDLKKLEDGMKTFQREIEIDEGKLNAEDKVVIAQKKKLLDDINEKIVAIEKEERKLKEDIEARKIAYEKLLIEMELTDKEELQKFNKKFGYSIKIDDKGIISLQKTSNNFTSSFFTSSNEEKMLSLFKDRNSLDFKNAYGKTTLLGTTIPEDKKTLGKDSTGKVFPLNNNKEILDDKIKGGFPPIIFGTDIESIMSLEEGVANVYIEKHLWGYAPVTKNLEVLTKQKIKQYIANHYTTIGEGDNKIYIMKTQIKFWEGAFENFNIADLESALNLAMKEKQENVEKYKQYTWSRKGQNNFLSDLTPTPEAIDNVFGVYFDYFDNLIIRGVDKSHPEQQSINAIRGNVKKGKMVDGKLLDIIPLNIYQSNLNNYEIDFDNDDFEVFFPGRIELTR